MRGKKLLTTLAVSAVLFAGCGLKSGEAIIKVNNQNITQGQFDAEFDKQAGNGIAKALGIDVKDDKNSFLYMLIKDRVVNELIVKALLNQEMQKRGKTPLLLKSANYPGGVAYNEAEVYPHYKEFGW